MKVKFLPIWLLLGCCLAACSSRAAWTAEDSWHRPPPAGSASFWEWPLLDQARLHEVAAANENAAEGLLRDASLIELTPQQAADLLGKPLSDAPGTEPYLVRGVYLNQQTGRFMAYVSEEKLVVFHRSMGSGPVPMKRQALVLELERKPAEVFVGCSMAQ